MTTGFLENNKRIIFSLKKFRRVFKEFKRRKYKEKKAREEKIRLAKEKRLAEIKRKEDEARRKRELNEKRARIAQKIKGEKGYSLVSNEKGRYFLPSDKAKSYYKN